MVDPDNVVSAVLATGVAACFVYGYLAGHGAAPTREAVTVRSDADSDDHRVPADTRHRKVSRQPRSERLLADRSPGTAPPHARRRPRPGASRNP